MIVCQKFLVHLQFKIQNINYNYNLTSQHYVRSEENQNRTCFGVSQGWP